MESSRVDSIAVIGVNPAELPWLRILIGLLRHPDPVVPELARQALRYLENAAAPDRMAQEKALDNSG